MVRKGAVYQHKGHLFKAKVSGNIKNAEEAFVFPKPNEVEQENAVWKFLKRGTFVNPWRADQKVDLFSNDVYVISGRTYVSRCDSSLAVLYMLGARLSDCLDVIDVKQHWVSLLYDVICDRHLSDVVIPSTHGSGSWGIDAENSVVDKAFLFGCVQLLPKDVSVLWSVTQGASVKDQLEAGYRHFDLKITDSASETGEFHWWNGGLMGSSIREGLEQFRTFAESHPMEILLLEVTDVVAVGNSTNRIREMSEKRKGELVRVFLAELRPLMVHKTRVSDNPTVADILATKHNVIVFMEDDYIRKSNDRFWPPIIQHPDILESDPENLFFAVSDHLHDFKEKKIKQLTRIGAFFTPDEHTVAIGMKLSHREEPRLNEWLQLFGSKQSFSGVDATSDTDDRESDSEYPDLLSLTRNKLHMKENDRDVGVQLPLRSERTPLPYHDQDTMLHYWLSRPNLFKPNIIQTDDFESSSLVSQAILANAGDIMRETMVCFQGDVFEGQSDINRHPEGQTEDTDKHGKCSPIIVQYYITSREYDIIDTREAISSKTCVTLREGEFPPDALLHVQVNSPRKELGIWTTVYRQSIDPMIAANLDIYVRGGHQGVKGFAYTSYMHDVLGEDCQTPPKDGYIRIAWW